MSPFGVPVATFLILLLSSAVGVPAQPVPGSACAADYLSPARVGHGAGALYSQGVYATSSSGMTLLDPLVLPTGMNLNALHVLSTTEYLFSVAQNGVVPTPDGPRQLRRNYVYLLDFSVVPWRIHDELDWEVEGLSIRSLNAIHLSVDGTYLFSTATSHTVRDGSATLWIHAWEVWEFDRSASPRLRRVLDARPLGFNNVNAVSRVSETDLRISPKQSRWMHGSGGSYRLHPQNAYSVNPSDPGVPLLVFEGSVFGLRAIDAYSIGNGVSCDDADPRTPAAVCRHEECLGYGWVDLPGDAEDEVSRIDVVESSGSRLELGLSLPGVQLLPPVDLPDGLTYTPITAPGTGLSEECMPSLPVLAEWILIPNGTTVELQVEPGEPILFDDLAIPPVQPLATDCAGDLELPFSKCGETYETDADSPGIFATLAPTQRMRGQAATTVWLYPYQYNPVRRQLLVYPDLSVEVLFDGDPVPIPFGLKSESSDAMLRRTAVNADAVLTAQEDAEGPIDEPYDKGPPVFGPYGWDYIIVTHTKFVPAADLLAAWKKKLGFKAIVWELPSGWGDAEIRQALLDAYDNWGRKPEWLLIIGDAEYVPTFYETWHPRNVSASANSQRCDCSACVPETAHSQGHIGTDLYYATLDGDDYVPEMYLGRLSVDTLSQALERVNEIIRYEQIPETSSTFYGNAAICAEFEDNNLQYDNPPSCPRDKYEDKRFTQTSEDMALFLTKAQYGVGKTVDRIYWAESAVDPGYWGFNAKNFGGGPAGGPWSSIPDYLKRKNGFTWKGNGVDLVVALHSGRFLVTYRGHGARDHWRSPYFNTPHFQVLDNGNKLPVIWSFSCQTGWFDNETDFPTYIPPYTPVDRTSATELSFGEKWERHSNGGAIGIVAGTRVTFGFLNEHLSWGMMDAIWPDFIKNYPPGATQKRILRMGAVLHYGRQYMTKKGQISYGSESDLVKANYEAYHWFGDPSLEIRTQPPPLVAAVLPPNWWLLQRKSLPIQVTLLDDTAPLTGATVTVTKADSPSEFWVGTTDEEGNVIFPDFVAVSPGAYDVVASAPDTVPFEGSFTVTAGPAAGILLDAAVYACSSMLEIRLADTNADPPGGDEMGDLFVEASTTGGDNETVVLFPDPDVSGAFVGYIAMDPSDVSTGDGTLQVGDGQDLLVRYHDDDDGESGSGWIETSAVIDCTPPDFDGLISATSSSDRVVLEWAPATDPHPAIFYNIYRGDTPDPETMTRIETVWTLFYLDPDWTPGQEVHYMVRAQDAAGNEDANGVVRAVDGE